VFGVGSVLWETLTGERLFDGKSDVEIFKKIRACQVPPIRQRRPDVPDAFAAVLDTALAADPANRHTTADEFAQALGQVMKMSTGGDGPSQIRAAVTEARARVNGATAMDDMTTNVALEHKSLEIEFSQAEIGVEPIELTKPKR
jgi:serine/threonine-protein kinase